MPHDRPAGTQRSSAWAPLRQETFREMWVAQFTSNTGSWMQTVGAQWLMLSLTTSTVFLALIQTATSLPVLFLALPAGVGGDLLDRRRLLIVAQLFMGLSTLALAALTVAGAITPWALLTALFLVGAGQAFTSPTWQTLQPELVPSQERSKAIALGAVNQNLARAVGPALGGALVALTEPSVVFLVNAASFLAVILAVWRWRDSRGRVGSEGLPREHLGEAMRASLRYVSNSPALRTVMLRAGVFVFFASSIWALLPAVATHELGLGSAAYGLLLGCVGLGAVIGATLMPRLSERYPTDHRLALGSLAVAGTALIMAEVHSSVAVAAALVVGGAGWVVSLATLNSGFQAMLPDWAKARAMAGYLVVFQGGNAIGSAVFGFTATGASLDLAILIAAAGLALAPILALVRPFPTISADELLPATDWPPPIGDTAVGSGPVMVSIEYRPAAERTADLVEALAKMRRVRRRTGAVSWQAWQDSDDRDRVLEQFVVGSWEEHERQHARLTTRDAARAATLAELAEHEPQVTHWAAAAVTPGTERPAGPLDDTPLDEASD